MNRAPLDAAFGITLMVAGAMIALPEKLKAKSAEPPALAAAMPAQEEFHRCEEAKLAMIVALQKSDADGYRQWEQRSRLTCQAAGF